MSKQNLVEVFLQQQVLRFGEFVTKSGRTSPYFFNTGNISDGASLGQIAQIYAEAARHHFGDGFDNFFGPAYKGIALCTSTAVAYQSLYGRNLSFTYNRKEAKDHGEGGVLIGNQYAAPTRVVIIEDVLTAGTSIRDSLALLRRYPHAKLCGILLGIDRQERGLGEKSALESLRIECGVPVHALINIDDLMALLGNKPVLGKIWLDDRQLELIRQYRKAYGAASTD